MALPTKRTRQRRTIKPLGSKSDALGSMSPAEFQRALEALGLSQAKCARLFGVSLRSVTNWATRGVPPVVETLIRLLVAHPAMVLRIREIMDRPELPPKPMGRPRLP